MSNDDDTNPPAHLGREGDWDSHVADVMQQLIQQRGVTYEWLATQVTLRSDTPITGKKLKEQISRGNISARLLLQIIDSLGDKQLSLKDFSHMESAKNKEKE